MNSGQMAILATGLVTSVGLGAAATCAAIRAKVSNPTQSRFIDAAGDWILAHSAPLAEPWSGRTRLSKMAVMAIEECLADVPRNQWGRLPLLLCVSEPARPGRLEGLDDQLMEDIQSELGVDFAAESATIALGRVGVVTALAHARTLIRERDVARVLVAATDSLLNWETLAHYEAGDRLLTRRNSDGFMAGEGAGALLVGPSRPSELLCAGIGFGTEAAHLQSGEPLRAEGLTIAHRNALADARCEIHHVDFRINDLSGEQYYFKEADLALSRLMRVRQEDSELWHPAECTGAGGAAIGAICFGVAQAAFAMGYAPGAVALLHFGDDLGARASVVVKRS